jgi:hypothetical protein
MALLKRQGGLANDNKTEVVAEEAIELTQFPQSYYIYKATLSVGYVIDAESA